MTRIDDERTYWDRAAIDPDVDVKYIAGDISTEDCAAAIRPFLNPGVVLEIGCGVGRLTRALADSDHQMVGIDISQAMVDEAESRSGRLCHFVCDGRTIPFAGPFASVYSMLVFQHLPPEAVEQYIAEAARVLEPCGTFVFQFIEGVEQEPFSHHYPLEFMENLLKKYGFILIRVDRGLVHKLWTWVVGVKS